MEEKKYVYGMRLRGFDPGCQPKEGLLQADDGDGRYHSLLTYDRPLSQKELDDYELDLVSGADDQPVQLEGIKELRQASGMTQKAFSDYFGFSKRAVESWEGGQRECPQYLLDLVRYKLEHEGLIRV